MAIMLLWILAGVIGSVRGECGQPSITPREMRIVGGTVAKPYSWPWQVAVYTKDDLPRIHCGGSLLNENWVVSAAHCFPGDSSASEYQIALGIFNHTNLQEAGAVIRNVQKFIRHPTYRHRTKSNDIVLVKLSSRVKFTDHIHPICLPRAGSRIVKEGDQVYATGWGLTTYPGSDSQLLRQVLMKVIKNNTCVNNLGKYNVSIFPEIHMCAGDLRGGKDTCKGDSGGPLNYFDRKSQRWMLVGITSFGKNCGSPHLPGVYTRVTAYPDWIQQHIPELPFYDAPSSITQLF